MSRFRLLSSLGANLVNSSRLYRIGLLCGLFIVSLLWAPSPVHAQDTTQQISLAQGWNNVSLHVQPTDSSFSSIFEGHLGKISIVKDEKGKVYSPSQRIEQITAWEVGESYLIYAEESFTLDVTGPRVLPRSTSIALEPGWNMVPYLPSSSQAVEQALVSIEETLLLVEGENEEKYDPSASTSPLDSLRPGQGYKVYVNRADTLAYPEVVNTLDDALALQGVEVGHYVRIRGYHEPGDGGGGLFQVRESACRTDGGTCFVFGEDMSDEESYTVSDLDALQYSLPHSNLVWKTISVKYGSASNDVLGIWKLHSGARSESEGDMVDTKSGTIGSHVDFGRIQNKFGASGDYTIRYKYAISNRRLVRTGVTNAVNPSWWGAPVANPSNPTQAVDHIQWAIDTAHRLYRENNQSWAYVNIDNEYYFHRTVGLREGVEVRGTGSLNTDGYTRGTLTVTPGKALDYKLKSWSPTREDRIYAARQMLFPKLVNSYNIAGPFGLRALELNGNIQNNQNPFQNPSDYEGDIGQHMQNGNVWTGFYTSGSGGESFQNGAVMHRNDLNIHDFGAGGLGGVRNFEVQENNVNIKNVARNHSVYQARGTGSNITIEGYSFGAFWRIGEKNDGVRTITNVTIKNLVDNPYYSTNNRIFGSESKDVTVDGIDATIDIQLNTFLRPNPPGTTIKNGTVKTDPGSRLTLFQASKLASLETRTEMTMIQNMVFTDRGGGVALTSYSALVSNIRFKDVTVEAASGVTGTSDRAAIGQPLRASANRNRAFRMEFDNVSYTRPFKESLVLNDLQEANPIATDAWLIDSDFNNIGKSFIFYNVDVPEVDPYQRVYLDNTTVNTPTGSNSDRWHKWLGAGGVGRMRNCQDSSGRLSDNSGSYTSDASDEGNAYVLIPTSLMSRPGERSATLTSSPSGITSITSVEIANSDGSLRTDDDIDEHDPYLKVNLDGTIGAGETVAVDWTARVTPLDEYSTTGLFVSRPVANQSYTSGNGPWQIDLRGVAASQESREAIIYTASSSDTGVVAASVAADGYTLDLAEAGTGTATITVTGKIGGVGTTTMTFDVSVK